jgi:hypothetical protein
MPTMPFAFTVKLDDCAAPYIESAASGGISYNVGLQQSHTTQQLWDAIINNNMNLNGVKITPYKMTHKGSVLVPSDKRLDFVKDGDKITVDTKTGAAICCTIA